MESKQYLMSIVTGVILMLCGRRLNLPLWFIWLILFITGFAVGIVFNH